MITKVLELGVVLISLLIWAVVGLLVWIPLLVRGVASFSLTIVYVTITDRDAYFAGQQMKRFITLYHDGFLNIMSAFQEEAGERSEEFWKSAWHFVAEVIWAAVFWFGTLWLLGFIQVPEDFPGVSTQTPSMESQALASRPMIDDSTSDRPVVGLDDSSTSEDPREQTGFDDSPTVNTEDSPSDSGAVREESVEDSLVDIDQWQRMQARQFLRSTVVNSLDGYRPGWQFTKADPFCMEVDRRSNFYLTTLARGDFDGDYEPDFATLIRSARGYELLMFLRVPPQSWRVRNLTDVLSEEPGPGDYLSSISRPARVFDLSEDQYFQYESDLLVLHNCESSSIAFGLIDGRVRFHIISD